MDDKKLTEIAQSNASVAVDTWDRNYETHHHQVVSYRENVGDTVIECGGDYNDAVEAEAIYDAIVLEAGFNMDAVWTKSGWHLA